ncbi:hypothetical protein P171DRAFT_205157 [Karstenula rhodostoma CBS 690.94]|uniref:Branchpoint-bridging protein n=1 Tax=Karstenula rhodostoma CBS 690.94 TaxID=1392251 RepID=A0A9P4PVQ3_9PLEO|nr:hypothetical protein P171DRAFT_205157 [Karstenula rhodostoma CBS 690.94]
MESESGAKIAIRGKGSVKEGKGRSDAAHTSNQEEDLHCLIMADTEDKVNKAKKLIHNVIETVRTIEALIMSHTNACRRRPSPKARTSSSATSSASLPPSTVLSVTTRTKPARTVARSVTASTTVPRSKITRQASSAVSVDKLDTWLAIVPSARLDSPGATTTATETALKPGSAVPRTSSTASSTRWVVVAMVALLEQSNTMAMEAARVERNRALRSLGNSAQLARLLLGLVATSVTMIALKAHLPRRGPVPARTRTTREATEAVQVLLLGRLLAPTRLTATEAMATTNPLLRVPLLLV